jgi:hypothetical protein
MSTMSPRNIVLILDVARFKYPPHWVSLPTLFAAMQTIDSASQRSRGTSTRVRACAVVRVR